MSCANFQELLAGQGAATATDFTPANIDFPYDSDDDLRLDIYNYQDQAWVNVPLATGATIDVGGAGDVFYAWETYLTNGQTGVRTILATAGTTPALPAGGTASHPLAPANNNYPVQGGVGVNVRLYRQTSIEAGELPAYFYPGASIRAQDLNDNFESLRKVVEESSCSTNNITDGTAQLDARYWNKVDVDDGGNTYTSTTAAAWPSNDTTIATTAAGDARWLNATGGNVVGGAGIGVTEAGGNVTIAVDLHGTTPGLELDPAGNTGKLRALGNSVTQTGGTDADPNITNGPSNIQITGGANVTVTRNSANQLTIAAAAATGGATFRGTVDVDNDNTLPATTGQQNPNAVAPGDAFTVENNVAAADVTANWNTVLDNWDTGDGIINSGDVILCTTAAAAGSPTDARYNLVRTGGNINTLQQVTDAGNTTTNDIVFDRANGDGTLTTAALTANRTYTLPDATGTIALTPAGGDPWVLDTAATPDTITAQGTDATVVIPSGNITTTGNDNIDLDPAGTGTVIFGANATAEADLTVTTNLTVNGNTTLGDADTDTVTVEGTLTCNENVTLNNDTAETTTINGILNFDIGLLTEV